MNEPKEEEEESPPRPPAASNNNIVPALPRPPPFRSTDNEVDNGKASPHSSVSPPATNEMAVSITSNTAAATALPLFQKVQPLGKKGVAQTPSAALPLVASPSQKIRPKGLSKKMGVAQTPTAALPLVASPSQKNRPKGLSKKMGVAQTPTAALPLVASPSQKNRPKGEGRSAGKMLKNRVHRIKSRQDEEDFMSTDVYADRTNPDDDDVSCSMQPGAVSVGDIATRSGRSSTSPTAGQLVGDSVLATDHAAGTPLEPPIVAFLAPDDDEQLVEARIAQKAEELMRRQMEEGEVILAVPDDVENRYFGRSENRDVRNLKALVILVLLLVTLAVCLAIYFITANGQQDEFEASFSGSAAKVAKSFEDILEQKIAAIAALGVTFTLSALESNRTWPFVTISEFQQRSASARTLSKSYSFGLVPIVSDENRLDWEEYSVANRGWLQEGLEYQAEKGLGSSRIRLLAQEGDYVMGDDVVTFTQGESMIAEKIFRLDETTFSVVADPGPGPYYPMWQSSPVLPSPRNLANYNLGASPQYGDMMNLAASTGQIILGGLDTAPPGDSSHPDLTTSTFSLFLSMDAGKPVNYTGEPLSNVYVPVLDSFDDDRKPVALILAIIRWGNYFEGILTVAEQPLHVVLSNTCQGAFTYEIRGGSAIFMGQGNLASSKNEHMVLSFDLDSSKFIIEPNTIALTLKGENSCHYNIRIYPTKEGDDDYNDMFPLIITLTVGAVFLMTAAVLYFYDVMVERRQKVVLATAQRSTAIVSSIFPRQVRDQLLQTPVRGNATQVRSRANDTS